MEQSLPERRPGAFRSLGAATKTLRIALIALHVAAVAAVATEWLYPFPDDSHGAERPHVLDFIGSYALYGFGACVVLVLLGIALRRVVMRGEDYYRGGQWW